MNRIYSEKMISFLRDGYKKMMSRDLTSAFNKRFRKKVTHNAIKSVLTARGIVCGRGAGYLPGWRCIFTNDQIRFIKKFYRKFEPKDVAEGLNECFNLNFTDGQVRSFIHRHGIRSGRNCQFKKGLVPWNAGTKGMGICKGNSGNFKKGHIPANRKPLWSERIDPEGYVWIKVPRRDPHTGSPTRYMLKHAWVWELKNGKFPQGANIVFRDGDRKNCSLKNLALVTDAELAEMNKRQGFGSAPAALKPSIIALSKLKVKTSSLKRRKKEL